MKTLTDCFLNITILVFLTSLNLLRCVFSICVHNWIDAGISALAVALGVCATIYGYKRAKRIEVSISEAVDTLLTHTAMESLSKLANIVATLKKDLEKTEEKDKDDDAELEKH